MITNEMKAECDLRREEIQHDDEFQKWISDIRCCCNMYRNIQEDRISISNQTKMKKDHSKQVLQKNWTISPEQEEFNKNSIIQRENIESMTKDRLGVLLKNKKYPIWNDFLKYVIGIGPVLAGILISRFRPENIYYVSNLYSYAGIVAGKDKLKKGEKAHFDVFLRAKLLGVLSSSFIKLGSEYALYYYSKRIQLINRDINLVSEGKMVEEIGGKAEGDKLARPTAGHHNRMAIRHMIQSFIRDYYVGYREIMDIPVVPGYAKEKLKLSHVGDNFVSFDIIKKWAKEKPEERKKRREDTCKKINEYKEVLQKLTVKYGYKEEEE